MKKKRFYGMIVANVIVEWVVGEFGVPYGSK